jgi:predicted Rossmann fold flavoprotein
VKLAVLNAKGKPVVAHQGDMIFTHFGISGPIALRCSGFIRGVKQKSSLPSVMMVLDLFPDVSTGQLEQQLQGLLKAEPKKAIKNVLKGTIPERLLPILLERSELSGDTTFEHLRKDAFSIFIDLLKGFKFEVTGTRSFEEAFVTGGGVNLKEIVPSTMESKLKAGLFFCGEVLDIHGYTGGYNITAAFSTGHTAGYHAALRN